MCHCEGNKVPRVNLNFVVNISLEAAFGDIQDLAYGAQGQGLRAALGHVCETDGK